MSTSKDSELAVEEDSGSSHVPSIRVESAEPSVEDQDPEERGRLKRRRLSSHSPPRASSPSRGHDRESGSRHRHHYRKHRKQSSSASISPPAVASSRKHRRRSDAEPDHTLRGRARKRSKSGTRTPIAEDSEGGGREYRKRSPPPSRHHSESVTSGARRQRSLPNSYKHRTGTRGQMLET